MKKKEVPIVWNHIGCAVDQKCANSCKSLKLLLLRSVSDSIYNKGNLISDSVMIKLYCTHYCGSDSLRLLYFIWGGGIRSLIIAWLRTRFPIKQGHIVRRSVEINKKERRRTRRQIDNVKAKKQENRESVGNVLEKIDIQYNKCKSKLCVDI